MSASASASATQAHSLTAILVPNREPELAELEARVASLEQKSKDQWQLLRTLTIDQKYHDSNMRPKQPLRKLYAILDQLRELRKEIHKKQPVRARLAKKSQQRRSRYMEAQCLDTNNDRSRDEPTDDNQPDDPLLVTDDNTIEFRPNKIVAILGNMCDVFVVKQHDDQVVEMSHDDLAQLEPDMLAQYFRASLYQAQHALLQIADGEAGPRLRKKIIVVDTCGVRKGIPVVDLTSE